MGTQARHVPMLTSDSERYFLDGFSIHLIEEVTLDRLAGQVLMYRAMLFDRPEKCIDFGREA